MPIDEISSIESIAIVHFVPPLDAFMSIGEIAPIDWNGLRPKTRRAPGRVPPPHRPRLHVNAVGDCGYPRSVRPLLFAVGICFAGCGNRFNTNAPNDFGKSKEQPPAQKIERTPKQWCLDYCSRARSCADKDGDEVFKKCKADHHDCVIDKTENTMCCAEMATCAQFTSCSKEGAPAGC